MKKKNLARSNKLWKQVVPRNGVKSCRTKLINLMPIKHGLCLKHHKTKKCTWNLSIQNNNKTTKSCGEVRRLICSERISASKRLQSKKLLLQQAPRNVQTTVIFSCATLPPLRAIRCGVSFCSCKKHRRIVHGTTRRVCKSPKRWKKSSEQTQYVNAWSKESYQKLVKLSQKLTTRWKPPTKITAKNILMLNVKTVIWYLS